MGFATSTILKRVYWLARQPRTMQSKRSHQTCGPAWSKPDCQQVWPVSVGALAPVRLRSLDRLPSRLQWHRSRRKYIRRSKFLHPGYPRVSLCHSIRSQVVVQAFLCSFATLKPTQPLQAILIDISSHIRCLQPTALNPYLLPSARLSIAASLSPATRSLCSATGVNLSM
jgi:hypothetical protein